MTVLDGLQPLPLGMTLVRFAGVTLFAPPQTPRGGARVTAHGARGTTRRAALPTLDDFADGAFVFAPAFADLHEQLEVDGLLEERLEQLGADEIVAERPNTFNLNKLLTRN